MFSSNNHLGKLIVVEGTDGSGKTTTCKKLSDYINSHPEEFDGYTFHIMMVVRYIKRSESC